MGARKWEDETGRVRWQPELEDGPTRWLYGPFEKWGRQRPFDFRPALYRSRARAERAAAREERRRSRRFGRVG